MLGIGMPDDGGIPINKVCGSFWFQKVILGPKLLAGAESLRFFPCQAVQRIGMAACQTMRSQIWMNVNL